jgi:hypothetical protein
MTGIHPDTEFYVVRYIVSTDKYPGNPFELCQNGEFYSVTEAIRPMDASGRFVQIFDTEEEALAVIVRFVLTNPPVPGKKFFTHKVRWGDITGEPTTPRFPFG